MGSANPGAGPLSRRHNIATFVTLQGLKRTDYLPITGQSWFQYADMTTPVHLALYQPDIPQNVGAIMRTSACLGVPLHIIEPCGFVFSDKRMRRAGMDYIDLVDLNRHASWETFRDETRSQRLVLLTTAGDRCLTDFDFAQKDMLLFGRESAGVPEAVHDAADVRLRIPIRPESRSLNLAASTAMVLAAALTQLGAFPGTPS